jgi:hypothetical protein
MVCVMKENQEKAYSLLEFTIQPNKVASGRQKLKASIKNRGDGVLRNMVLLVQPLNEGLSVIGGEKFIYALMPGQEATINFQVFVAHNSQVYFSLSGFKNCDMFFRTASTPQKIVVEKS